MSVCKVDEISNTAGDKTVPTDTVVQGSAKAWALFDCIGTVVLLASHNVSSITDLNIGQFDVNFSGIAFTPDQYIALVNCDGGDALGSARKDVGTKVFVRTRNTATGSNVDDDGICVACFGETV